MTPEFSKAVDPIFLHVLRLLEASERGDSPLPKVEREHIRGWINQAEAILGPKPDWQLAKYALVAWIDEVLIEADWEGRDWWNENALEQELFNHRWAYEQFYVKAKEASTLRGRDALEVFYVCVVLGFRGLYRDPLEATTHAEAQGLPPTLEEWAKQTSTAIRLGQGLPPIGDKGEMPEGAPALEGKAFFVSYLLIAVILAGINLIVFAFLFRSTS